MTVILPVVNATMVASVATIPRERANADAVLPDHAIDDEEQGTSGET